MHTFPLRRALPLALPAATALLGAKAHAQIIYTPLGYSTRVSGQTSSDAIDFNLGDGAGATGLAVRNRNLSIEYPDASLNGEFTLAYTNQFVVKPAISPAGTQGVATFTPAGANGHVFAQRLDLGTTIDASLAFQGGTTELSYSNVSDDVASFAQWQQGTSGYVGVRFFDNDNGVHYGWIHLAYGSDGALGIAGVAYEATAGAAIAAGNGDPSPVPEPASAALGAAILAGSAALYRRRQQRPQTA